MSNPVVSVVVATYKREFELKKALESLALQSMSDFEIILVDDNGNKEWNDKVADIVSEFRKKYPSVILQYIVNSPNQGSAKARNIGIEASNGEFVTFLDDDDIYLSEKLTRQVEFMQLGKYDYSITDLLLYNENDRLIDKRIRNYITDTSPGVLLEYHLKYHITGTDTMMFRRKYLDSIGGFAPINVGDEFYLMQRAIEGRGNFGYLPGCDVKAYVHTGEDAGVSSGDGKIKGENELFEYKKGYFCKLDKKVIRYIKARHFAVIAFAELRRKKFGGFVINSIKSGLSSPIACVKILMGEK